MKIGERFDKFMLFMVDKLFSAGIIIVAGWFIFALYKEIEADSNRKEEQRVAIEKCYSQGMVVVDTDAGERCADPRSLVKVK